MASGASGHGAAETAKLKANVEAQLARLLAQLSDLVRRQRRTLDSRSGQASAPGFSHSSRASQRARGLAPTPQEELRAELEDDEYEETRRDTMEQIAVRAYRGPCVCASRVAAPRRAAPRALPRVPPRRTARPQEFDATLKRMLDGDMTLVSALGQVKLAAAAAVASAFKTPEVIRAFAAREPAALRGRLAALNEDARLGRMTAAAAKTAAIEIILALKKLGEALTADEAAALASASAAQRAGFEAADRAIAEASVMSMTRA